MEELVTLEASLVVREVDRGEGILEKFNQRCGKVVLAWSSGGISDVGERFGGASGRTSDDVIGDGSLKSASGTEVQSVHGRVPGWVVLEVELVTKNWIGCLDRSLIQLQCCVQLGHERFGIPPYCTWNIYKVVLPGPRPNALEIWDSSRIIT